MSNWKEENDKLIKDFKFKDFQEAFGFLTQVAIEAEKAQHHPEIKNVYNQISLALTSHDAGSKVTDKDHKLAEAIDKIAG